MRYVNWTSRVLLALIVFAFLHYTLPQRDIVWIADTYEKRIDFGENSIFWASPDVGTAAGANRDVFFIQAIRENGKARVYRNEDTGWGWPPYFKIDTSNLQAEAASLKSSAEQPKWVAIRHYGWRNEFMSIFPNAVGVKQVDGPDARLIPWLNIVILTFLLILALFLRALWRQFRERTIDPILDDGRDRMDRIDAYTDEKKGRVQRWLDTWRRK